MTRTSEKTPQERAADARRAKVEYKTRAAELQKLARDDPEQMLMDLFADLSAGVKLLTEKWLARGDDPSRNLMDALREFRQSLGEVRDTIKLRGKTSELEAILAEVATRISSANLEARPRPVSKAS